MASCTALAQTTDRASALYSTQIHFDDHNVPIVTIGIMDQQDQIGLQTKGPLKVLPDGPNGTEIVTGTDRRWTVKLETSAQAHTAWRVRLETYPADELKAVQAARQRWKERGVNVMMRELGSVFGFFGKVMDTRRTILVTREEYDKRADAEAAATRLASKHQLETDVMPVMKRRARGTIVMTDGRTTIRGKDVLWLAAANPRGGVKVEGVEFGRGFHWHGRENRVFRGTLYVTVDASGKLAIANMVPAETLLRGLVPSEIYASAPPDALKAQAIAARAELLAKIGTRHLADPYLICSDVHCQAYKGIEREDDRTDRAVAATRGQMLFHKGNLVDTVYSASCGGHTEHNENVWDIMSPKETLRGGPDGKDVIGEPTEARVREWVTTKSDSYCGNNRYAGKSFRWEKRVPVDVIRRGLKKQGLDAGVPRRIEVLKRGVSGRVIEARVHGTHGRKVVIRGELNIRKAFGGLRSSLFALDTTPGPSGHPVNFKFTGAGFGHGVGMCQTGAIGMALEGHSFEQILRHYYKGAKLERIY